MPQKIIFPYERYSKAHNIFQNEVRGYLDLASFSIGIVSPGGNITYLTSDSKLTEIYLKKGFQKHDKNLSPDLYQNYAMYSWRFALSNSHKGKEISDYVEQECQRFHGAMLVRKINNFHLLYGFSSSNRDPATRINYLNSVDNLLMVGDYLYSEMREVAGNLSQHHEPPKISNFIPFSELLRENGNTDAAFPNHYCHNYIILSDREKEITRWCSYGKTYEEIGIILNISKRTVEKHVENAKEKLHCRSVVALVAKAIRTGVI